MLNDLVPHLHDLLVRVRVHTRHESRASGGPVLREQPSRLVPDPTGIAQRLWAHRAGPPLWGLVYSAVHALPYAVDVRVEVCKAGPLYDFDPFRGARFDFGGNG